jgi:hypothetical protein
MALVLVATGTGCRVFSADIDWTVELPDHFVWAIAHDIEGGCLAIVDEMWNPALHRRRQDLGTDDSH